MRDQERESKNLAEREKSSAQRNIGRCFKSEESLSQHPDSCSRMKEKARKRAPQKGFGG